MTSRDLELGWNHQSPTRSRVSAPPPFSVPAFRSYSQQDRSDPTRQRANKFGAKKNSKLSASFGFRLKLLGVILSILAAFSFGLALSNTLQLVLSYGDLLCLSISSPFKGTAPLDALSYFINILPNFPPAFVFIVSIFCAVLKDPRGKLIKYLYNLTIVTILIIVPIYIIFAILAVLQAQGCLIGVIQILKLTLPIIMVLLGFIILIILIYLAIIVRRNRKKGRRPSRFRPSDGFRRSKAVKLNNVPPPFYNHHHLPTFSMAAFRTPSAHCQFPPQYPRPNPLSLYTSY